MVRLPPKRRRRSSLPKGPQPKTTCPTCSKQLSQHALARHRGTEKCAEIYWRQQLLPKYKLPAGYSVVHRTDFAWRITKKAGYLPEASPVRLAIVWQEGNGTYPSLHTIAPTWYAIVLQLLTEEFYSHKRNQGQRTSYYGDPMLGEGDVVEEEEDDHAFMGRFGVLEQDTITLLQYFRDLENGSELALALGAELDLVARDTNARWVTYDLTKVSTVLRRWSAEVLSNL